MGREGGGDDQLPTSQRLFLVLHMQTEQGKDRGRSVLVTLPPINVCVSHMSKLSLCTRAMCTALKGILIMIEGHSVSFTFLAKSPLVSVLFLP